MTSRTCLFAIVPVLSLAFARQAAAVELSPAELVKQLQHGGDVLVMRHASSPPGRPGEAERDPANVRDERQLDAGGKASAIIFAWTSSIVSAVGA